MSLQHTADNGISSEDLAAGEAGIKNLDTQVASRGVSSGERLEYAKALAMLGLGPSVIADLTGWQATFAKKICVSMGTTVKGGRMRSSLLEIMRVPVLHSTCSRFVMAIEHQMQFWGENRLTARSFMGAVNYIKATMPAEAMQIPSTALYSIAVETAKRTMKTVTCSRCRGHYAQASLESRLTDMLVYDCPFCRQIAAIIPGKGRRAETEMPTSMAELNLRGAITRFPSKGAEGTTVRAVMGLVYGGGSARRA